MKLTCIAATTNEMMGDERRMRFTMAELELMAAQAPGTRVSVDFDRSVPPVGMVVSAHIEGESEKHEVTGRLRLVIEMMPAQTRPAAPTWPVGEKLYCVPGVTGIGMPPDFRVTTLDEFAITAAPADTTLEPLTLKEPN